MGKSTREISVEEMPSSSHGFPRASEFPSGTKLYFPLTEIAPPGWRPIMQKPEGLLCEKL